MNANEELFADNADAKLFNKIMSRAIWLLLWIHIYCKYENTINVLPYIDDVDNKNNKRCAKCSLKAWFPIYLKVHEDSALKKQSINKQEKTQKVADFGMVFHAYGQVM